MLHHIRRLFSRTKPKARVPVGKGLRDKLGLSVDPTGDLEVDIGLFWNAGGDNQGVQSLSHWRGIGNWGEQKWLELGDFHWRTILDFMSRHHEGIDPVTPSRGVALEWGPGGGSNVRLLCQNFERVIGVDISKENLQECAQQVEVLGFSSFEPVFIESVKPESATESIEEASVDLILCTAVFQHFPSKNYAHRVLSTMARLLKPGGYALIQVRYPDDSGRFEQKDEDYFNNVITMTSFTNAEFRECVEGTGLSILESSPDLDGGYASYEYHFLRR